MPSQFTKFNLPTSWSLIKDTRTRTSLGSSKRDEGYGGILPGGYGNHGKGNRRSTQAGLWSPYARPPRRSKRLVLIWVGAFLAASLFMWYISTRHGGLARSYTEVLVHQPQKEVPAAVEE